MKKSNEEFAEKHAGEYFLYRDKKVRAAGYCADNGHSIPVSVPKRTNFGRGEGITDRGDALPTGSGSGRFRYADESLLTKWE